MHQSNLVNRMLLCIFHCSDTVTSNIFSSFNHFCRLVVVIWTGFVSWRVQWQGWLLEFKRYVHFELWRAKHFIILSDISLMGLYKFWFNLFRSSSSAYSVITVLNSHLGKSRSQDTVKVRSSPNLANMLHIVMMIIKESHRTKKENTSCSVALALAPRKQIFQNCGF